MFCTRHPSSPSPFSHASGEKGSRAERDGGEVRGSDLRLIFLMASGASIRADTQVCPYTTSLLELRGYFGAIVLTYHRQMVIVRSFAPFMLMWNFDRLTFPRWESVEWKNHVQNQRLFQIHLRQHQDASAL